MVFEFVVIVDFEVGWWLLSGYWVFIVVLCNVLIEVVLLYVYMVVVVCWMGDMMGEFFWIVVLYVMMMIVVVGFWWCYCYDKFGWIICLF